MTAEHNTNPDHKHQIESEWLKRSKYDLIKKLDEYFTDNLETSLVVYDTPRSEAYDTSKMLVLSLPGSGMKLDSQKVRQKVDESGYKGPISVVCVDEGIYGVTLNNGVTSHEGCGAAAVYKPADKEAAVFAVDHAKEFAEGMGIPSERMISLAEMNRPDELHNATGAIIDYTGTRNREYDGVAPVESFVLSAWVYNDQRLLAEHLKLLSDIAFGAHGLGLAPEGSEVGFSSKHPFYFFVIANDQAGLEKDMEDAKGVAASYPAGVVRVVGYVASKK